MVVCSSLRLSLPGLPCPALGSPPPPSRVRHPCLLRSLRSLAASPAAPKRVRWGAKTNAPPSGRCSSLGGGRGGGVQLRDFCPPANRNSLRSYTDFIPRLLFLQSQIFLVPKFQSSKALPGSRRSAVTALNSNSVGASEISTAEFC